MYCVAVKRSFSARHYLIGGDWGEENDLHTHDYRVEVRLEGSGLDEHGYLVDIVDIEQNLERLTGYYRDRTLNDLPRFAGINPSIEHFARILCQDLSKELKLSNIQAITVRVWENDIAWASYREELT